MKLTLGENILKIKIEEGVPIPNRGSKSEFLRKMNVGDSVFVEKDKISYIRTRAFYMWGTGACVTRKDGNGYRVWRVK
mgnify:CR=1 FL=1